MSDTPPRAVAVPFAFDTTIGYWTGEPDWDLLARALRAADPDSPDPCCPDAWLARARTGTAPALRYRGIHLTLQGATLFLAGDPARVEAVARELEQRLARG